MRASFTTEFLRLLPAVSLAAALTGGPAPGCPCSEFKQPADSHLPAHVSAKAGVDFTNTTAYRNQLASAVANAKRACQQHIVDTYGCIVSDLDETLLDNRQFIGQHTGPNESWSLFTEWVKQAQAPLLKPTAEFLSWARRQGFAVFFVTGRTEDLRAATIANLVRRGVAYDGLFMRAVGDKRSAVDVKSQFRKDIEEMGFKIIVNIGDQPTDLLGGHSVDCELLPNEMYSIP